jgi:nucleoside-diphosphate-sugar epimerase
MGENLCACWASQYGIMAKIARSFHTYGPGLKLDDGRVFADFIADILAARDIRMKSDGTAMRAYCYLADAIRGLFTILLSGEAGEAYNVGNNGAYLSVLNLAEILVGLFPEKKLKVIRTQGLKADGYIKSTIIGSCPNISKLSKLGWTPRHTIESGFRRTIASFY